MSLLLEIQKQLETASQRVVALERALAEHPDLPSIAANLETAVRIQTKLRAQFAEAAEKLGFDVCTYRAFDVYDRPKTAAALEAIADFQKLVSVVYAAIKHGHKQRATIPESVAKETEFGFGYAFTGSLGIVLTVRNEKLLIDSDLDESINAVFALAKAKTPAEVLSYASKLGPGPINALYEWAEENAENGLGADIVWQRGSDLKKSLFVQHQELSKLRTAIEETSSETSEELSVVGTLTAADVTKNRFKLNRFGLPQIRGTFVTGTIDESHRVSLPMEYLVQLRKTTKIKYSTGASEVRWQLLGLKDVRRNDVRDGQAAQ